jgi:hypothetical protein
MNRDAAVGSAEQQRSEKPLLTVFGAPPESPPLVSSRLPEPPRLGYTNGCTAPSVIDRQVIESEYRMWCKKVVPAQGFEPWTIGLKDRCSAKLSYAG